MKNLVLILTLAVLFVFGTNGAQAQSTANYAFTFSNAGSLVDMSTGTTSMLAAATYHDDVASSVTNIGFTFTLMGVNYTQFSINSNGQLRLGSTVISGTAASPAAGVPLIAPMGGDNAIQATGKVHYKIIGSSPTQQLVMEWNDLIIPYSPTPGLGSVVQVILSEAGGVVEFRYGTVNNNSTSSATRSIFFASSNIINSVGSVTIGATPTYSTAATPVSNTFAAGPLAVANLSSTSDGSRWVYTFTPPVGIPVAPINLTFTSVGRSAMTVNWVDASTNEAFFTVSRATAPAGPYTVVATVASTTSGTTGTNYSSVQSGLSPSTTYYFRIAAAHEGAASSDLSGNRATETVSAFNGAYTINKDAANTGTNYTTFAEAFLLLNLLGVTGPTTFTVTGTDATVTYAEGNLTLGGAYVLGVPQSRLLTSLNVTNTLTFINGTGKTINMSGVGIGATDFVFRLMGVDYVTFDGINIVDVGTTNATWFEFGYVIGNASNSDGANNNTIRNMSITLNKANTSITNGPYGVVVGNGTTIITFGTAGTYASRNNFNKIQNFTISGVKRGIQFDGLALPAFDEGNEISGPAFTTATGGTWIGGSRITNWGGATSGTDYGIGIDGQKNLKVFNVQIDSGSATTAGTAMSGIHFGTAASTCDGADNVEIYNCVVRNIDNVHTLPTAGVAGIRATATTLHTVKIYNTAVYDLRNLGSGTGNLLMAFQFNGPGAASKIELYNNSVNISSVHTNVAGVARGILTSSAGLYIVAKNNVIQVTGGGSTGGARAIELGGSPTLVELSNNLYNVGTTSASRVVGVYGTTLRQNLIDWQSTMATPSDGLDQSSGYGDPGFISGTNLLYGATNSVNNSGVPITGLSTNASILGVTRSSTAPDIGAFEGDFATGFADVAVPGIFIAPLEGSIAAEIPVTIRENVETGSNLSIRLWYRGTPYTGAFTALAPDVTPTNATNGTYRWNTSLRGLAAGTYQYYIVARDAAGNSFAVPTMTPGGTFPGFTTSPTDPGWVGTNPFGNVGVRTFQNATTTLAAGTYTVGTGSPDFTTLTAVAQAISQRPLLGNVIFELTNNYDGTGETFPIVFNQPSYSGGGPFTITIRPAADVTTERVVQGDPGTGLAIIYLDGARRVTIDGRPGGVGTSRLLRVSNSRSAATIGEAIALMNDALNNTIRYVIAESNNLQAGLGVVGIGGTYYGGQGNNNNTIDNCDIRNFTGGNPLRGLVTFGSGALALNQNNTFSNNLIHDFHAISGNPIGIRVANSVGTIITGNHIYQTTAKTGATALTQIISVGPATGPGHTIAGNFIGGNAPNAGGTAYTLSSSSGIYVMDVDGSASTTSNYVGNNTIENFSLTTSAGTAAVQFAGILGRSGNQIPVNINGNTIGNTTVDGNTSPSVAFTNTGAVTNSAIPIFVVAGLVNVTNNQVGGFKMMISGSGTAASFTGIQVQSTGVATRIDSNLVGSTTVAGNIVQNNNSSAVGIASVTSVAGTSISYNTVANILYNAAAAGTGQGFTGISASGTAPPSIVGNVIRDVVGNNHAGTTGISMTASGLGATISKNVIRDFIINPQTASTSITITGILISSSASTGQVLQNSIYNLVNGSTSTGAILRGIYNGFGTRWTYANNMISLGDGSNGDIVVRGVDDYSDGAGGGFWYYNSILISGSVPAGTINTAAFYRTTSSTPMTLRNNIFVNLRVGPASPHRHFAIVNPSSATGWTATASDYNVFKTTTDTIGQWLGVTSAASRTFEGWKTSSGGDATSIEGSPVFININDLHLNPINSVGSNNGLPIAEVLDDFDGEARNATTPDRGADEYIAAVPAAFALLTPTNGQTSVALNGSLTWGTSLYANNYDVYLDKNNPPTTLVSANQTAAIYDYLNLDANSTYYWLVTAKNGNGNTVATGAPWSFTTVALLPPNPPTALTISNVTTNAMDLRWTDNSIDETGFYIYQSLNGSTFNFVDSVWADSVSYTGTHSRSLNTNTQYWWRVAAYNTNGISAFTAADKFTLANTPGQPILSEVAVASMKVTLEPASNPVSTEFVVRVVFGSTTKYMNTAGALVDAAVWGTYTAFGGASGRTATGLSPNTTYTIGVKARNGDNIETIFGTSASAITSSYPSSLSEDFATYTGFAPPPIGWNEGDQKNILDVGTFGTPSNGSWTVDGFGNVGTTGAARFNYYGTTTDDYDWIVSPNISLTAKKVSNLKFDIALTLYGVTTPTTMDANDTMFVVLSTDGGNTFPRSNVVAAYHAATPISNTGQTETVNLSAYFGEGNVRIGFYVKDLMGAGDKDFFLDNVRLEAIVEKDIQVLSVNLTPGPPYYVGTASTVTAQIRNNGTETNPTSVPLTYKIGTAPTTYSDGTSQTFTPSWVGDVATVTFTVLHTPAVTGDFTMFVKAFYPGDLVSANDVNSKSFKVISAGALFEDFTDVDALARWKVVNLDGGAKTWLRTTAKFNSSPASAGSAYEGSTLKNNDWLITPKLTVAVGDSFTFWHSISSTSWPESLIVRLSTTDNNPANFGVELLRIYDNTLTWKYKAIDLTTYAGQNVYIAFVNVGLDRDVVYVDDISGPLVYIPAVDLAFTSFFQSSGLPTPKTGIQDEWITWAMNDKIESGTKPTEALIDNVDGERASDVNRTIVLPNDDAVSLNMKLNPVNVRAKVKNVGLNASTYTLNWNVSGATQPVYNGPSVPSGVIDSTTFAFNPAERGTFLTSGSITVAGDENPDNNSNAFRMRVYPDAFTRTIYDRGDNLVDTWVGWGGAGTTAMKAGVRNTATSNIKLAGVDFICNTEIVTTGTITVQVRAAGAATTAPGPVLYTRHFTSSDYFPGGGGYITFPFEDSAPIIASGSDYWITVKFPVGILYPGGVHNAGFTAGRSFYEGSTDTTVWNPLVITTERAWIMRAYGVSATPVAPVISNVARTIKVPLGGDPLTVIATIVDGTGINAARLLWTLNGTITDSVVMVLTSGTIQNGIYSGAIPGSANSDGNRIEYQIRAVSFSGLSITTTITALNSYFAGMTPLLLSGLKAVDANGQILYVNYYARTTGTINGPNYQTSNTSYFMQDAVGGINLFYYGLPTPVLNLGDSIIVVGKLGQYYGLAQITPDNAALNISIIDTGKTVQVTELTLAAFNSNPELYESMLIKLNELRRKYTTPAWPGLGGSANIEMYQFVTTDTITMRIDSDTEIDGSPEPIYPVNVVGIAGQYKSSSPYNTGYQIQPRYLRDFTQPDGVGEETGIPAKFALYQNYPNPFNPTTNIKFALPEASIVTVDVYNILGQKVKTLINEERPAGYHTIEWGGRNSYNQFAGSGAYYLRISAEGNSGKTFTQVRKMLMLK